MTMPTVAEIQLHIDEARHFVELGNALERLERNPDFKLLIQGDYLQSEAVRLVHLLADPDEYNQSPTQQAKIKQDIHAIGALAQYFNVIRWKAGNAAQSIAEGEATREEMESEEAEV